MDSVTVEVVPYGGPATDADYEIYLDEVLLTSGTVVEGSGFSYVVDLDPSVCGNLVTVRIQGGTSDTVEFSITNVTL